MKTLNKTINSIKSLVLFFVLFSAISAFNFLAAQPNPNRKDIKAAFKGWPNTGHKQYVASVFDCDENKKLHEFTLLLTPDAVMRFGSNPEIIGRENVEAALIEFNKGFKHLGQRIIKVFKDDNKEIVYSAEATYSFEDGTSLDPIPYMVHLSFKGKLVENYKIYIDLSPLYQYLSKSKK
ncbi:MAG: hypothetical protein WCR52_21055 [Bacteroidota bacterium]